LDIGRAGQSVVLKAIGFDLVGTLCHAGTREDECIQELCSELARSGVNVPRQEFVEAYDRVALKYLEVRKATYKEVNNRIWIAEALSTFGLDIDENDWVARQAADAYFRPYIKSIQVPEYVSPILSEIRKWFKIGLITNFTYAPAARDILQRNGLAESFDSVVVSDEVGWRKPHANIFQRFLNDVSTESSEAFFIGDDPRYDIMGAKNAGMKSILLRNKDTNFSESYYVAMEQQDSKPDITMNSLYNIRDYLLSLRT